MIGIVKKTLSDDHKKKIGEGNRRGTFLPCPICRKPFSRTPSEIKNGKRHTCSIDCGSKYRIAKGSKVVDLKAGTKRCSNCKEWLPIEKFNKSCGKKSATHGLSAYCAACSLHINNEWKQLNPEKLKIIKKRYSLNNAPKIRIRQQNLSQEQRDKKNEAQRAYRKANPGTIRELNRARNNTLRSIGKISRLDIVFLLTSQKHRCVVCRCELPQKGYHLDHITPIAKGGQNGRGNLQILCATCNMRKNDRDPIEFMQSRGFLL